MERLPSGSYRVRKQINGTRHTFTFDHKPTKREIEEAIANLPTSNNTNSFCSCAEDYIRIKESVLSPSTIRGYSRILKHLPSWFLDKKINSITTVDVQKVIGELAKDFSPKTIRNKHGFISAVLGLYRADLVLHTQLPQRIKKTPYMPTEMDIRRLLEYAKGTDYEIAIFLGCHGLRRSEMAALTMDKIDFKTGTITIDSALVEDNDNNLVRKTTKTESSTRIIPVSPYLLELIQERGLYSKYIGGVNQWMRRTQEKYDIPKFSFHKLRYYFASHTSAMLPEADVLKLGGWETPYVMKSVYRQSTAKEEQMKNAINQIMENVMTIS